LLFSNSWLCNNIITTVVNEYSMIYLSSDSNSLAFNRSYTNYTKTPRNFSTSNLAMILSPSLLSFNFYNKSLNSVGSSNGPLNCNNVWSKDLVSEITYAALYIFDTLIEQAAMRYWEKVFSRKLSISFSIKFRVSTDFP